MLLLLDADHSERVAGGPLQKWDYRTYNVINQSPLHWHITSVTVVQEQKNSFTAKTLFVTGTV